MKRRKPSGPTSHLVVVIPTILIIGLVWIVEISQFPASGLVVLAHSK